MAMEVVATSRLRVVHLGGDATQSRLKVVQDMAAVLFINALLSKFVRTRLAPASFRDAGVAGRPQVLIYGLGISHIYRFGHTRSSFMRFDVL